MKAYIFPFLLLSLGIHASEHVAIRQDSILSKVGDVSVYRDENGWHIMKDSQIHRISNCWVDPLLRQMKVNQLQAWQDKGYIIVNDLGGNEYGLRALGRVNGGGPILAGIVYWGVKSLCYGGMMAVGAAGVTAAGVAVVGTGGAATPAVAMAATGVAAGIKVGLVGAGIGASVAATGITAVGGAGVAAGALGSTAAAAGGIAGLIAAIECAAVSAAAGALLLPTP